MYGFGAGQFTHNKIGKIYYQKQLNVKKFGPFKISNLDHIKSSQGVII